MHQVEAIGLSIRVVMPFHLHPGRTGLLVPTGEMSQIPARHIGEGAAADDIEQAVLVTLESGIRSGDMAGDAPPTGTKEFADAIISNLGRDSSSKGTRDFGAVTLPEVAVTEPILTGLAKLPVAFDSWAVKIFPELKVVVNDVTFMLKLAPGQKLVPVKEIEKSLLFFSVPMLVVGSVEAYLRTRNQ